MQLVAQQKWVLNLLISMLGALLLPFVYASFFAFPQADDFSWSYLVIYQKHDFWRYIKGMYLHTNSRFTTDLLMFVSPVCFKSLVWYQYCAAILTIGGVGVYALFLKKLCSISWRWGLLMGLVLQHLCSYLYI